MMSGFSLKGLSATGPDARIVSTRLHRAHQVPALEKHPYRRLDGLVATRDGREDAQLVAALETELHKWRPWWTASYLPPCSQIRSPVPGLSASGACFNPTTPPVDGPPAVHATMRRPFASWEMGNARRLRAYA